MNSLQFQYSFYKPNKDYFRVLENPWGAYKQPVSSQLGSGIPVSNYSSNRLMKWTKYSYF